MGEGRGGGEGVGEEGVGGEGVGGGWVLAPIYATIHPL